MFGLLIEEDGYVWVRRFDPAHGRPLWMPLWWFLDHHDQFV